MDMSDTGKREDVVLCGASAYSRKFYLNEKFGNLPQQVKDELKILCVLFTEDVGGTLCLLFDADGTLKFQADCDEGDLLYGGIGCGLRIRELQRTKGELLEALELYYRILWKKEGVPDGAGTGIVL